jgi:tRNA threonylcarbamoyladenosine biosynthesis protein TsaB
VVLADAQRGDVYAASFRRETPAEPLDPMTPTRIIPLADLVAFVPDDAVVLGPALASPRLHAKLAIPASASRPETSVADWPDPHCLAGLARDVWQTGRRDDPWYLEPLYLRRSAAEDQWERAGR